jgi:glycerophosphoryl diester phosphodiesterase
MHDETVNRTTNGRGSVSAMTHAEITQLDAGSWFASAFAGERVPTLAELLHCAAQLEMGVNVEIKPCLGKDRQTAYRVVEILEPHKKNFNDKILVSSFSLESLAVARALTETFPLGIVLSKWIPGWQYYVQQLACFSLHVDHNLLTAEMIQQVKLLNIHLLAYTVDSPERAAQLFAWGVDAVFSNVPDRIIKK